MIRSSLATLAVLLLVSAGCAHKADTGPASATPSKAQAPDAAGPSAKTYDIRLGSWNVKKLGHGGRKDYAKLASVIDQNFDILAIIEVMQKGGEHPGYEALMNALGVAWTGQETDTARPATVSSDAQTGGSAQKHRSASIGNLP